MKKIVSIEGMHCMHCAQSVENAVNSIPGASGAKVNLDKKTCVFVVKSVVSDSEITSAVKQAGFEVTNIQTKKSLL